MATPLKNRLIAIAVIFALAACCLLPISYCHAADKYIRAAILQDIKSPGLSVKGFYRIINGNNGKVLSKGKYLKAAIAASQDGISIGGINYKTDRLFIEADDPQAIIINGRKYRGNIQFIKKDNLRLTVINYIGLEDYVKGILFHEVSHYWPQEALRAQAIVCRTYAIYRARESSAGDYDVTSDIYSQIYGGRTSERYRTSAAVNETKGLVLTYHKRIFPAYFHATCGGHTEDAALLWNIDIGPLKGVVCNFCKDSPHFNWQRAIPLKQIEDKLSQSGYEGCANIRNIVILNRDASGRIGDLNIESANKELGVPAKQFRSILGPNIIRSTNFNLHIAGDDAIFKGFGWGHGVGMCQWGAYFMAKRGHNHKQILSYYYPQSEISSIK